MHAGRPVDVEQMPDGSLLISDDETGAIYRVTYNVSNADSTSRGVASFQGPAAAGGAQRSSVAAVRPSAFVPLATALAVVVSAVFVLATW
jgi:hypothetical protein